MGLSELRDKLQKSCKGMHVSILSESTLAKRNNWIKSSLLDLNRIISGSIFKSLPEKSLSLFVGPEQSFKSSSAAILMAEAQKEGYIPIVFDTEGAWTDDFIKRWGGNPNEVMYIYTPWVHEIKIALAALLDKNKKDTDEKKVKTKSKKKKIVEEEIVEEEINTEPDKYFIILDSIGGLDKYKIVEDAQSGDPKQDQGGLQKDIKPLMKLLLNVVKAKNSIAVCTGHYYGSPGQYGNAEDIGGGKFVKLAPDIIISYKKSKLFNGTGKDAEVIGSNVTAITLKNRFYPPFNEAKVEIDYIDGINKFAGILDLAVDAGFIEKGGAGWYTIGDKKLQGDEKLLAFLNQDKLVMNDMLKKVDDWLKDTGFSTVNEEVKELIENYEEEE